MLSTDSTVINTVTRNNLVFLCTIEHRPSHKFGSSLYVIAL